MRGLPGRERRIAERGAPLPCPWCGSGDTERTAEFGPFHMTETYRCRACASPFSRLKWDEGDGTVGAKGAAGP